VPRVVILCRRDDERLRPIAEGLRATLVVYRDTFVDGVRAQLRDADAVLVWVDPISGDEDRSVLNDMLRQVAAQGVVVGTHPDTIDAIGTKDVLFRTRHLGWASDVARYASAKELRDGLESRLRSGPRVIKRERGNAGIGVWRVEVIDNDRVAVHGAEVRDLASEDMTLDEFVDRCASYFVDGGCVIDQRFEPRVAEGIVRCYVVVDEVVGFAHQGPGELATSPERIMGLPSPKTMFPPDAPQYAALRRAMETQWIGDLRAAVGLSRDDLPLLWDADFLLGEAVDSYVLCEINASCVTPFPPETPAKLAQATLARIEGAST
jgi:hypothetical protein